MAIQGNSIIASGGRDADDRRGAPDGEALDGLAHQLGVAHGLERVIHRRRPAIAHGTPALSAWSPARDRSELESITDDLAARPPMTAGVPDGRRRRRGSRVRGRGHTKLVRQAIESLASGAPRRSSASCPRRDDRVPLDGHPSGVPGADFAHGGSNRFRVDIPR